MGLVINVSSKTKVFFGLDFQLLIDRLVDRDGIIDDEVNDRALIDANILEELISDLNSNNYFMVQPGDMLGSRKIVFNSPKEYFIYRRKEKESSSGT